MKFSLLDAAFLWYILIASYFHMSVVWSRERAGAVYLPRGGGARVAGCVSSGWRQTPGLRPPAGAVQL